jgi:TM2 domain-containing membrane protein YozV
MKKKSNVVACVLAICLGGFGAHKFYLGKPIQGIIYLFACFVSFIAGIVFITGGWAVAEYGAPERLFVSSGHSALGNEGFSFFLISIGLVILAAPILIAAIEGIIYISNKEKFDAKYNEHFENQNINKEGYAKKKSNILAGVLAIFFWSFGAHKFYLGKPIQGIIYLLVSFPVIVFSLINHRNLDILIWDIIIILIGGASIIEGIIYISNEEKFDAKYNKHLEKQYVSN